MVPPAFSLQLDHGLLHVERLVVTAWCTSSTRERVESAWKTSRGYELSMNHKCQQVHAFKCATLAKDAWILAGPCPGVSPVGISQCRA